MSKHSSKAPDKRTSSRNSRRESPGGPAYKYPAPPIALGNDAFRVLAFPESQPLVRLTDMTTAVSWEDKSSEMSGSLTIQDPTGKVSLHQNEKIRLDWAPSPNTPFQPLWAMLIEAPQVQLAAQTQTLSMTTALSRANKGTDNYSFRKGKGHPHGWTADQVARHVCAHAHIPVGKLAGCHHRITKLVLKKAKPIDAIIRAYTAERHATGHLFFIYWDGRLNVLPLTHSQDLLLFAGAIIDAQYQAKLPHDFATSITARATVKAKPHGGKHVKRRQRKLHVTVSSPKGIKQFGYVHADVNAPDAQTEEDARKYAKAQLAKRIKPERLLTVTIPFRPTLRRGNAFQINWKSQGLTQICYVSGLSHNVAPSGSTTTITCQFTDPFTDAVKAEEEQKRKEKAKKHGRKGKDEHAKLVGSYIRAKRRA